MTQKNKVSDEPAGRKPPVEVTPKILETDESKTSFIAGRAIAKYIILIILILGVGIFAYFRIIDKTGDAEIGATNTIPIEQTKLEELQTEPKESDEVTKKEELLEPYIQKSIPPLEKLESYRLYLFAVNSLTIKFLQDKPYGTELQQISRTDLLGEIELIIHELKDYNNNYLENRAPEEEIVFPKTFRIIERFISIKKEGRNIPLKEALKARISKNLPVLTKYFYSSEFEQKFIDEVNKQ